MITYPFNLFYPHWTTPHSYSSRCGSLHTYFPHSQSSHFPLRVSPLKLYFSGPMKGYVYFNYPSRCLTLLPPNDPLGCPCNRSFRLLAPPKAFSFLKNRPELPRSPGFRSKPSRFIGPNLCSLKSSSSLSRFDDNHFSQTSRQHGPSLSHPLPLQFPHEPPGIPPGNLAIAHYPLPIGFLHPFFLFSMDGPNFPTRPTLFV